MEILKYPNSILTTPCKEVQDFKEARKIAEEMKYFMQSLSWGNPVGLAANQVGYNLRMFWAMDNLYINPQIIERSPEIRMVKEGCYSLEDNKFDYPVKRNGTIHIIWYDKKGDKHSVKYGGFKAQVIQHEFDHINGKLCVDYK